MLIYTLAVVNKNKWESTICLLYAPQFLTPANRENQVIWNWLGQFHSWWEKTYVYLQRKFLADRASIFIKTAQVRKEAILMQIVIFNSTYTTKWTKYKDLVLILKRTSRLHLPLFEQIITMTKNKRHLYNWKIQVWRRIWHLQLTCISVILLRKEVPVIPPSLFCYYYL